MVTLISEIQIGSIIGGVFSPRLTFDYVHECEITASWEDLTSTAKIILPKRVEVVTKDGTTTRKVPAIFTGQNASIKRNDRVRIYAGYRYFDKDGPKESKPLRFEGVVTRVDPSIPITIYCEDSMFLLKQKVIKFWEHPSATLKDIMEGIMPKNSRGVYEIPFETEDVNIGKFKIENATISETFDYLKREFGFSVFFQDGKVYAGFRYQTQYVEDRIATQDIPVFHFQHNIIEGNSLEYYDKEELKYKVQVINIKDKNKRTEIEIGDPDGDIRTLHFYDAKDADLEIIAKENLNKMKFTGYRGSFTTFLEPMIQHGSAVEIRDDMIEDRNGQYLVKEVTTRFGVRGGRQTLTLDRVIA